MAKTTLNFFDELSEKMDNLHQDDLAIDTDDLIEEWRKQAGLVYGTGEIVAFARDALRRSETELDLVKAEVSSEIRSAPELFGIEKVTEGAIKEKVLTDERYSKKEHRYNRIRYFVDLLDARMTALENKKKALEKIADLTMRMMNSEPVATGNTREYISQQKEKKLTKKLLDKNK